MKKNQKNEQNKEIYVNQNLLNIISPSGISFDNNYADIGEGAVSYTHLDVYKRQVMVFILSFLSV